MPNLNPLTQGLEGQDTPMTLLDLDAAGVDLTQPAPPDLLDFLDDNSVEGYVTLWSDKLNEPGGADMIADWINAALEVYYARTIQTQMAPLGDKPTGDDVTEITYTPPEPPPPEVDPENTVPPAITGTPAVGQTLTCSTGTWINGPIDSYAYEWRAEGVAISGATNSTWLVDAGNVGDNVQCLVIAHNAHGWSASPGVNSNTVLITA